MKIGNSKNGKWLVLDVTGRMDVTNSTGFENECAKWVEEGEKHIVADLSGLAYISSAGLRSLLASAKKLKAVGGELRFCHLGGMVEEVFKVSGFGTMFKVSATVEEAMAG